jgi:Tol biopolymer transport system component
MVAVGLLLVWFIRPATRLQTDAPPLSGPLVVELGWGREAAAPWTALRFDPPVAGRWEARGQQLWFWPQPAFQAGQAYTLTLPSGRLAGEKRLGFMPRLVSLAFIGDLSERPEVWLLGPVDSAPHPLTRSGGQVEDFAAAPTGDFVVYSALNAAGGTALWQQRLDNSEPIRLVDCGALLCLQPAISPDGGQVAYSQGGLSGDELLPLAEARLYLLDLATRDFRPLQADASLLGLYPAWSPDGSRLSFYDPSAAGIRVLDLQSGANQFLATRVPQSGSWLPDSRSMLFTDSDSALFRPFTLLFEADLLGGGVTTRWADLAESNEIGQPQASPAGSWVAVSLRPVEGFPGRQLWRIRLDGSQPEPLTSEVTYQHAAYRWSPDGGQLAYQRLSLTDSDARPEVWLWDAAIGSARLVATDAGHPAWLP